MPPLNEASRFLLGSGGGAIIGSFLATIVMRWPRGESVVRGRSRCDGCDRSLGVFELVPLLGYVIARGRCRQCGARIDPIHAFIEAGAALIGGFAWLVAGQFLPALTLAMAGWILLTLAVLDARHYWLPDGLTLALAVLGLTLGDWVSSAPFGDRAVGAGIGYIGLLAIALGYRAVRHREGLGLGDAKLLGGIGAWLGWQALPLLLLGACVTALIWALALKLSGRPIARTTRIPLGTFLCIAVLPAWLLTAYLGLY